MSLIMRGGVWHVRKMVQGHTLAKSTKTADKKLAEQIAATYEAEFVREILINKIKPVSLHQAIDAFLRSKKGTVGYQNAELHLRHFKALPNATMSEITLAQAQSVIEKRRNEGRAHNTIALTVTYWNAMCQFCTDQGWTTARKLKTMQSVRTRKRVLTMDEQARIIAQLDPTARYPGKRAVTDGKKGDNRDLVIALLHLGCRLNEAQTMRWSQVNMADRCVFIKRSKGGNDGTVAMSELLYRMFSRRLENRVNEFVWPNKASGKVNTSWFNDCVLRAKIDQTIGKVTLHTLRHSFATRMLNGGMTILEVQELLGHKHLDHSLVYLHTNKSAVSERALRVLNATS
jgi:integrase